jgi:hypothetical protein
MILKNNGISMVQLETTKSEFFSSLFKSRGYNLINSIYWSKFDFKFFLFLFELIWISSELENCKFN